MGIENPVHLIFIGIVALLVLGPRRLPELARALGHGIREFREAVSLHGEPVQVPAVQPTATQTPIPQPPSPAEEPVTHTPLVAAPVAVPSRQATQPATRAPVEEPPFTVDSTAEEDPEPAPRSGQAAVDPVQPIRSGDAPDRGPL